ncbi:MAG: hypothetical protein VKL59_19340 [Nostocaceae cyanobacterium]|nr:hypothetical protein [Nostocaceae cyanobacterium]
MPKRPILEPGKTYSFRNYYELNFEPDDILAEFDCTLNRTRLHLNQYSGELDRLNDLRNRIEESLIYTSLTSEAARRELLIAPILIDVCHYTHCQLRIEYPIAVSERLKGDLDYYLQSKGTFLVIEAKNADLAKGFTQLAVELIALDQWTDLDIPILCGAVTTGDVWRFGVFHRQQRRIDQDLELYKVPGDLENLLRILVGVLG